MVLIVIGESKQSTPISSRVTDNHSTFTGPISIASISDSSSSVQSKVPKIMHLKFSFNSNKLNAQTNSNRLHNLK